MSLTSLIGSFLNPDYAHGNNAQTGQSSAERHAGGHSSEATGSGPAR